MIYVNTRAVFVERMLDWTSAVSTMAALCLVKPRDFDGFSAENVLRNRT